MGLRLFFLPTLPGAPFIRGATFIPDSRVLLSLGTPFLCLFILALKRGDCIGWISNFISKAILTISICVHRQNIKIGCPFAKKVPQLENHFDKRTVWSLIYFLNYAYFDIEPRGKFWASPSTKESTYLDDSSDFNAGSTSRLFDWRIDSFLTAPQIFRVWLAETFPRSLRTRIPRLNGMQFGRGYSDQRHSIYIRTVSSYIASLM